MKRSDLQIVITILLIILFCYTAIAKLMDIEEFRRQLANQELPEWSKTPLLWLIPGSELLLSVLLSVPQTRKMGYWGSAILMSLFSGYIGLVVMGYFDRVPCSCGGVLRSMSFETHLVFNLFFLALTILGLYMFHSQNKHAVTQELKNE